MMGLAPKRIRLGSLWSCKKGSGLEKDGYGQSQVTWSGMLVNSLGHTEPAITFAHTVLQINCWKGQPSPSQT